MTPDTPEVQRAARHLANASAAEDRARADWETAASNLANAHTDATGNPAYRQAAWLWDSTAQHAQRPGLPTAVVARIDRLTEAEHLAREARDRTGRATVAARRAHHDAQQRALAASVNAGITDHAD